MKNISIKFLLVVFKTYISNLPKSIKVLLLINIVIYFISIIINWVFSYDLKYTFGAPSTCSEKFKVYQIFTNNFFHDINHPDHIIGNLILFLLFAPAVSRIIGDNNTIKLYVFSGLISFLPFNYIMNIGNNETVDKLTKTGFDVKKIKESERGAIFNNTNEKQNKLIRMYRKTSCLSYGASGSISGFIIIFPLLFIKRKKSILLNLLVLLIVIDLIDTVITNYNSTLGTFAGHNGSGTFAGHLGGVIGGIIFFIFWLLYLKNKSVNYLFTENKKVIQNEAAPILQINAS
jgi:membrane associated rhomboid family serine protease